MRRRNLKEIVGLLPRRVAPPIIVESPDASFECVAGQVPGYVWPDVVVDETKPTAPVLLVTAPGAMGKSAASRAISAETSSPRVDLARLRVGSDSLTGLMSRVLGWSGASAYVEQLRSGQVCLVLDSLDEAQLLAGRDNCVAFLGSLAVMLKGSAESFQVVIFGRRDSLELAEAAFVEFGLPFASASVAPLDAEQSAELINVTLDSSVGEDGRPYVVHRRFSEAFSALRDAVMGDIARALGATSDGPPASFWSEVEGFLGYPPVLTVLACRLQVDNPIAVDARERTALSLSGSAHSADLLREIVEGILDREAGKVRDQLVQALGIDKNDARREVLYTREEQILRVLRSRLAAEFSIPAPAVLEPSERATYEEQIVAFVPDHPFLAGSEFANPVFKDYVRAFLSVSQTVSLVGVPQRQLRNLAGGPGPFFAHFVYGLTERQDSASPIAEDLVDDLLKSHAAAANGSGFAVYIHGDAGPVSLVLRDTGTSDSSTVLNPEMYFTVVNAAGVLELTSPLSNCMIITSHGLVVGCVNDEVELGPNLTVSAVELAIEGTRLFVTGGNRDDRQDVVIIARSAAHDAKLRIRATPDDLKVWWQEPFYQWHEYRLAAPPRLDQLMDPAVSWQVMFGLRRLLTGFEKSAGAVPSVYAEKYNRFTVGGSKVFAAVRDVLQQLSVIRRDGELYRLNLEALSEYGVNYAALQGAEFTRALEKLHLQVCSLEPIRSLVRFQP